MRELFARVKALLRRSSKSGSNVNEILVENKTEEPVDTLEELVFSDVTIDFKTYRAKKGERNVSLSAKEFELIKYLSKQPDIPVSRDELLDNVWGYNSYPTTRTVDNFIARLRQKLEFSPEQPKHILTVHGVGYKFVNN
jgi:DNA-binding response OmpR family regulator